MAQQFVSDFGRTADRDPHSPPDLAASNSLAESRAAFGVALADVLDAQALLKAIKQALAANLRSDGATAVKPIAVMAPRLARFALAGDLSATTEFLRRAIAGRSRPALAAAPLLEAVASRFNECWTKEQSPEGDITVGLCILQMALRSLCAERPVSPHGSRGAVLVATPWDEPHGLCAVLASEVVAEVGFDVFYRPAASRSELTAFLRSTWVDAVTLHASPVFERRERLGALTSLIGRVRSASPNRGLLVAAHGACFVEDDWEAEAIGADATFPSCAPLLDWLCGRLADVREVACSGRQRRRSR